MSTLTITQGGTSRLADFMELLRNDVLSHPGNSFFSSLYSFFLSWGEGTVVGNFPEGGKTIKDRKRKGKKYIFQTLPFLSCYLFPAFAEAAQDNPSLPLSACVSLFLTHTHTHTFSLTYELFSRHKKSRILSVCFSCCVLTPSRRKGGRKGRKKKDGSRR